MAEKVQETAKASSKRVLVTLRPEVYEDLKRKYVDTGQYSTAAAAARSILTQAVRE